MYRRCPHCQSALDPGEICDCQETEEAAPGGNDTESGKEKISTNNIHENGGKVNGKD